MVKSFLMFFIFVLAIIGICELVYILRMLLFCPNIRVQSNSMIILKKGYAIKQLNYIWQKIKWYGDDFAVSVIALTDDIDYDERLDCINFINGKKIILCTKDTISQSGIYRELF